MCLGRQIHFALKKSEELGCRVAVRRINSTRWIDDTDRVKAIFDNFLSDFRQAEILIECWFIHTLTCHKLARDRSSPVRRRRRPLSRLTFQKTDRELKAHTAFLRKFRALAHSNARLPIAKDAFQQSSLQFQGAGQWLASAILSVQTTQPFRPQ